MEHAPAKSDRPMTRLNHLQWGARQHHREVMNIEIVILGIQEWGKHGVNWREKVILHYPRF